jgi:hypothetical protein
MLKMKVFIKKYNRFFRVSICFAIILAGNYLHQSKFNTYSQEYIFIDDKIETIDGLKKWTSREAINWRSIGKKLNNLFYSPNSQNPVVISVGPAGSIAFYSDLPVIDLLGLNTRLTRKEYRKSKYAAGHTILASERMLIEKNVNINIFHPQTFCIKSSVINEGYKRTKNVVNSMPFSLYQTILIPISENCYLIADYIKRHKQIDKSLNNSDILLFRDVYDKRFDCPSWLCTLYDKTIIN